MGPVVPLLVAMVAVVHSSGQSRAGLGMVDWEGQLEEGEEGQQAPAAAALGSKQALAQVQLVGVGSSRLCWRQLRLQPPTSSRELVGVLQQYQMLLLLSSNRLPLLRLRWVCTQQQHRRLLASLGCLQPI